MRSAQACIAADDDVAFVGCHSLQANPATLAPYIVRICTMCLSSIPSELTFMNADECVAFL
jgi:hypothetical protein